RTGKDPSQGCQGHSTREQVAEVLLWTAVGKRRILRNKSMLRDTVFSRLYSKGNRYPSHWKGLRGGRSRTERRVRWNKERITGRRKEARRKGGREKRGGHQKGNTPEEAVPRERDE